jgi:transposase InsO family protein
MSMTQQGDPYENAVAERVNGILKTDFPLNRVFTTFDEAASAVKQRVRNYNHLRPHMSCGYLRRLTPTLVPNHSKSTGNPTYTRPLTDTA